MIKTPNIIGRQLTYEEFSPARKAAFEELRKEGKHLDWMGNHQALIVTE